MGTNSRTFDYHGFFGRDLFPFFRGDPMAKIPAWQLQDYRGLLYLQVRQIQWNPLLRGRLDWSDLVQETLLSAHRDLDKFQGRTEAELLHWLRTILKRTAINLALKEKAHKRDVTLERSLEAALDQSSAQLENFVTDKGGSPSQEAARLELLRHLPIALEHLPENQREVVILRDLLDASMEEIVRELALSERAVAGLLFRGRRRLRELLASFR